MQVVFWGVRGSVAVGGPEVARVGGNTSCVELLHEGHRLVLDGGTGLAALGRSLGGPAQATVLFTHVHWDHIQGVPFFTPLYIPTSRVHLMGARLNGQGLREALDAQMRPPTFPVGLDAFQAQLTFGDVEPSTTFDVGPFKVEALAMDHPDGVLVYRIEAGGRTVVFATDVEHGRQLDLPPLRARTWRHRPARRPLPLRVRPAPRAHRPDPVTRGALAAPCPCVARQRPRARALHRIGRRPGARPGDPSLRPSPGRAADRSGHLHEPAGAAPRPRGRLPAMGTRALRRQPQRGGTDPRDRQKHTVATPQGLTPPRS